MIHHIFPLKKRTPRRYNVINDVTSVIIVWNWSCKSHLVIAKIVNMWFTIRFIRICENSALITSEWELGFSLLDLRAGLLGIRIPQSCTKDDATNRFALFRIGLASRNWFVFINCAFLTRTFTWTRWLLFFSLIWKFQVQYFCELAMANQTALRWTRANLLACWNRESRLFGESWLKCLFEFNINCEPDSPLPDSWKNLS